MSAENSYFQDDREQGTVIAADADWVTVELTFRNACHACGAKMLCQPDSSGHRVLKVRNTLQARTGDRVLIEQIGIRQLRLTAMQYGLPLALFLIFVIGGNYCIRENLFGIPRELILMLCGLVGVGIGGLVTYIWSKHQVRRQFSVFRLVQILTN